MAKTRKHLFFKKSDLDLMEEYAKNCPNVTSLSEYVSHIFYENQRLKEEVEQLRNEVASEQRQKLIDKNLLYLTKFTEIGMKKLALWGDEDFDDVKKNAEKEMEQIFNRLTVI